MPAEPDDPMCPRDRMCLQVGVDEGIGANDVGLKRGQKAAPKLLAPEVA
jgi:hypothetical protein